MQKHSMKHIAKVAEAVPADGLLCMSNRLAVMGKYRA